MSAKSATAARRRTLQGHTQKSAPVNKTVSAQKRIPARKDGTPIEIVVRRGALHRFDKLKNRTAELPVIVTWDRRTDERREGAGPVSARERRQAERRRTPPFTWDLADFVVVERQGRQKASAQKGRANASRKRTKTSKKS